MRFRYVPAATEGQSLVTNMTAMVDVMFNLLLFTLLSTSYIQHSAMEIQLPKATTGEGLQNQAVVVELTANDKIFLEGKEMGLEDLRTELGKIYASSEAQRPFLIRADEESAHGHVVALMDIARELGIKSLNIATLPKGELK